ncbi:MAG: phospholipid carrier-dependent glycosyltransferase [Actinomycetales bacterium]|nr:phospholipid carrier-dependent glycosyltransferase [Actinomycetales bacterium]
MTATARPTEQPSPRSADDPAVPPESTAPGDDPSRDDVPTLRARLFPPGAWWTTDRFWGWCGPAIIAAIGGFLRFWRLDQPPGLNFDEAYYVRQAYSLLRWGVEFKWISPSDSPDKAVDMWNNGQVDEIWTNEPDSVTHPPLGKWMIAIGEGIFGGDNRFGWRFGVALFGTLSILMLARIARRLFSSTVLGCTAGILLAVDGQHFTHSRTALLDLPLMFWVLAGFGLLIIDHDRATAAFRERVESGKPLTWYWGGLWLLLRPWRLAAAACFGLSIGVKISAVPFLGAFMLATVLWDLATLRSLGVRHRWGWLVANGVPTGITMGLAAVVAFLSTWTAWFISTKGSDRYWGEDNPEGWGAGILPNALRSLFHYTWAVNDAAKGITSPHAWESNPWSWMPQARPTMFWLDQGVKGCGTSSCTQAVDNLGNPVVWWGGTLALFVLLFCWALRRDWRAGAILAGVAAGYLPWFMFQERTIFTFYSVSFVPWVVLGLTYVLGLLLGRSDASPDRRYRGAVAAGSVVLLAVACFAYLYPILSADIIPTAEFDSRMWLPSWR